MPSRENRPVLYATIAFLIVSSIILVLSIVFAPEFRNEPSEIIDSAPQVNQGETPAVPPIENGAPGNQEAPSME